MTQGSQFRVGSSVAVRVPASSANLGPGFDSVGLGLGIWDSCTATIAPERTLSIRVSGEGCDVVPLDSGHLVYRAMLATWADLGLQPPEGVHLDCVNAVPHGRGLGSSASAIVAGVFAALALADLARTGQDVYDVDRVRANAIATRLEGHPDNASASIYGRATLSFDDGGAPTSIVLDPHPELDVAVLVPSTELSTAKARAVLPEVVRLRDAAANSARVGVLVRALTADPSLLLAGTSDRLHQEARRGSYPESMKLVDALRSAGLAATISGAGPSVLVLGTRSELGRLDELAGASFATLRPGIAQQGARLTTVSTGTPTNAPH